MSQVGSQHAIMYTHGQPWLVEEVVAHDGWVVLVGHASDDVDTASDVANVVLKQLQCSLTPVWTQHSSSRCSQCGRDAA